MAFYRVCEFCGCSLDPGEKCDCRNEEKKITEIESKKKGKRNIPSWRELEELLRAQ